ncbi:MAG: fliL [Bacteriovoracaceae bacterium]|nr:fliL [Bacteriovoracaceae bacterium]
MADKAEKPEVAAVPEEGGGKKKLPLWVIILIASQVVLVGVALVVFKMMNSASHAEKEAPPTAAEQKVDPEKVKDPKTLMGPSYDLAPFIVNLIDDGRGARYLKIEIKLELETDAVKGEIESRLPQIRDELLVLLSSKRQTDVETSDGKRILKDEIFTRANKILVTGRIKRVYFTEFVVQ